LKKIGITFKTVLVSVMITVMAMASFTVYHIENTRKVMIESQEKMGVERARLIAGMVKNAVIIHDYDFISRVPDIVTSSGEVGIEVTDLALISSRGTYLVHSDPGMRDQPVSDPQVISLLKEDTDEPQVIRRPAENHPGQELVIATKISSGDMLWGHVLTIVSLEKVEELISSLISRSVSAGIILTFLVVSLVYIVTYRSLLPLRNLNRHVRQLVEEGKIEKIHYKPGDEVGDLIEAFNSMMDNWQELYDSTVLRREEADAQRRLSDAVVDNIANGILVLDRDGKIQRSNRTFEENFQISPDEVRDRPLQELLPGWENEDTHSILHDVLKSGKIYGNERVYYDLPGQDRQVVFNVNICPIRDDGNLTVGAVALFEFLTDKVLLEEHLLKVNEELKKADDVKTEFLSMVSHELRTPLTLIKMYSSMMGQGKLGPLTEKQEKAVEVMNRRCRNLHELIDDLLDLSRIESGRMDMQVQEVDPGELIRDALGIYIQRAKDRGIVIESRIDPELPRLLGDREKLSRVLNNLLENALKFTSQGSIFVSVSRNPDDPDQALIRVKDTGCGIPDDKQHKVFEKFYQVDGSDTRAHGGSGLGLSIAAEIVELHHGAIWLQSTVGKGTEFFVALPFTSPEMLSKYGKGQPREPKRKEEEILVDGTLTGRKNVLLIDDDRDFLDMMADVLSEEGHHVTRAEDGLQGIEALFEQKDIDIILLDVSMPKISGYDVCRMIKSAESTRHIPIIILTAAGQSEQVQSGFDAGATGYMVKPFTISAFNETMRSVLGEK